MKGIEHFNHKEMGLFPLAGVAEFGPLVLLRLGQPMPPAHSSAYHRYTLETPEAADSSSSSSSSSSSESDSDDEESRLVRAFSTPGSPSKRWHELARRLEARHWNSLEYVTRRTYDIECNWKVRRLRCSLLDARACRSLMRKCVAPQRWHGPIWHHSGVCRQLLRWRLPRSTVRALQSSPCAPLRVT